MKNTLFILVSGCVISACSTLVTQQDEVNATGTWKLVSGLSIQDGDTIFNDYTDGQEGMKIITKTHFAFLIHDRNKGQDSLPSFVSGGGRVSINGLNYTEYLDYCNYRVWEGEKFEFDLQMKSDTLIQTGVEKVEATKTERTIIETYVRVSG